MDLWLINTPVPGPLLPGKTLFKYKQKNGYGSFGTGLQAMSTAVFLFLFCNFFRQTPTLIYRLNNIGLDKTKLRHRVLPYKRKNPDLVRVFLNYAVSRREISITAQLPESLCSGKMSRIIERLYGLPLNRQYCRRPV